MLRAVVWDANTRLLLEEGAYAATRLTWLRHDAGVGVDAPRAERDAGRAPVKEALAPRRVFDDVGEERRQDVEDEEDAEQRVDDGEGLAGIGRRRQIAIADRRRGDGEEVRGVERAPLRLRRQATWCARDPFASTLRYLTSVESLRLPC